MQFASPCPLPHSLFSLALSDSHGERDVAPQSLRGEASSLSTCSIHFFYNSKIFPLWNWSDMKRNKRKESFTSGVFYTFKYINHLVET